MDTGLRAGKIVYSQACMILALNNLSYLLSELGNSNESEKMIKLASRTIHAVEEKLWSGNDGCYIDIQQSHHIGGPYRTLTQDVAQYLVAISENTNSDSLRVRRQQYSNHDGRITESQQQQEHPLKQQKDMYRQKNLDQLLKRANNTLDAISNRIWLDGWPTNVETLLKSSGPWHLRPYFYHNRTFWPWITGIEILARSRFKRLEECNTLLSKLASEDKLHLLTFYEWVNPKTGQGGGAYPFRTGICTVRMAIDHIVSAMEGN
jgi:GH15 family glucan-1,4-alpha-glucosidase